MKRMPLLSPAYWFNLTAVPFMPWFDLTLAIVCAGLFVIGIGLSIYAFWAKDLERSARKIYKRYAGLAATAGASGLLLWFFNSQGVPMLSMRVFWIVWFLIFAYWAYVIIQYQYKELPAQKIEREKKEALRKWWPKPRK